MPKIAPQRAYKKTPGKINQLFLLVFAVAIAAVSSVSIQPGLSQTARTTSGNPTTQSVSNPSQNYLPNPPASDFQLERTLFMAGGGAIAFAILGLLVSWLSGQNRRQLEININKTEKIFSKRNFIQDKLIKVHEIEVNQSNSPSPNRPNKKFQISPFPIDEDWDRKDSDQADREQQSDNRDFQILARDLIESYHTQALAQATSQYWFSVIAASFGFAIIMYATVGALRSKEPQIALLKAIPGLAIEGVAVLFLTQADGTRKRATELYDRLRSDEKQLNAIALIESIQDGGLRDVVKAQLALQIVGIPSQNFDFYQHRNPQPHISKPAIVDSPEIDQPSLLNQKLNHDNTKS